MAARLGSRRARRLGRFGAGRRDARRRIPSRRGLGSAGGRPEERARRAARQGHVLAGRDVSGRRAHGAPRARQGRTPTRKARAGDGRDRRCRRLRGPAGEAGRRPRDGERAAGRSDSDGAPARRSRRRGRGRDRRHAEVRPDPRVGGRQNPRDRAGGARAVRRLRHARRLGLVRGHFRRARLLRQRPSVCVGSPTWSPRDSSRPTSVWNGRGRRSGRWRRI